MKGFPRNMEQRVGVRNHSRWCDSCVAPTDDGPIQNFVVGAIN